jgi:hypothetical protein
MPSIRCRKLAIGTLQGGRHSLINGSKNAHSSSLILSHIAIYPRCIKNPSRDKKFSGYPGIPWLRGHVGRQTARSMKANAVRLQLHALAYNLSNFLRTLALPDELESWSLTTIREKVVKIGAKVIAHARYAVFQMAGVAVPRDLFRRILGMIDDLRPRGCAADAPRQPAPC